MKKLLKILVLGFSSLSLTGCFSTLFLFTKLKPGKGDSSSSSESGSLVIKEKKSAKFYVSDYSAFNTNIYSVEEKDDVYYVDFQNFYSTVFIPIFANSAADQSKMTLKKSTSGDSITYTNSFGKFIIDANKDIFRVEGLASMLFLTAYSGGDFIIANGLETDYVNYSPTNLNSYTKNYDFRLCDYNIDIVKDNDRIYIPVNTFIDLIVTPNAIPLSFNGKDIFYTGGFNEDITGSSGTTTIEKKYYNESPWHSQTTRSEALANFTYNEMCFVLDHFYGLKATRGVSSFDELFASLGLRDDLKNTNSTKYNKALIRFGCSWLFEGHSGLRKFSPYLYSSSYQNLITDSYNTNEYYTRLMGTLNELTQSRQAKGKSVGLRVYNNTAIIAFDQFVKTTQDLSQVYSFYSYEVLHSADTYWMFRKAFEEIESNSAITNVVIDTTLNVGGMIDALVWLEAFFTSNPAITVRNTFTNQVTKTSYQVDLNRDGTFDSSDTYQGRYKFFLMTSRLSFSCGNAFPTLNKENGAMTIIGERSGGGSCAVGAFSTACGDIFNLSSTFQFGTFKNNAFYDNEDGIGVDLSFSRTNFYQDYAIYEFVNSID